MAESKRLQESEESGCAILPGAAAYLEAEVVSRLEAGDHWIVYAKVNSGKVRPLPAWLPTISGKHAWLVPCISCIGTSWPQPTVLSAPSFAVLSLSS